MANTGHPWSASTPPSSNPQPASPHSPPPTTTSLNSSTPVEMSQLPSSQEPSQPDTTGTDAPTSTNPNDTDGAPTLQDPAEPQQPPASRDSVEKDESVLTPQPPAVDAAVTRPQPKTERRETNPIGPAQETNPSISIDPTSGPAVLITLLLITGARHPFRIDARYLKKRNVGGSSSNLDGSTENLDPWTISVYTVKELIWRDWREEWEPRPSSPSSIRLIHFGRLLDDKSPLKECRLNQSTANVIHMTIKPSDFADDDEHAQKGAKSSSRHDRDGESSGGGMCRCVIL